MSEEVLLTISSLLYVAWDHRAHLPVGTAREYAREVLEATKDDPILIDEFPGAIELLDQIKENL